MKNAVDLPFIAAPFFKIKGTVVIFFFCWPSPNFPSVFNLAIFLQFINKIHAT